MSNKFTIETEKEEDGRWIADVQELPGVLTYGQTKEDAVAKAEALALRVDPIGVAGIRMGISR